MPFDRNGIWIQPTEEEKNNFVNELMKKPDEISPTPEMIQAIKENIDPKANAPTKHANIFNAIGKLKGPADIVIPVYDGLHVLKPCINSVIKNTEWDYKLIIVDDCSPDPEIREYLLSIHDEYPNLNHEILWNKRNRGFAPSVNRGVAQGVNPYICILNSDTLVTKNWLVKQLIALEADPKNVIVNPVTNNTALVNVPMYNGCSYLDMADALDRAPNSITYNEIMPTGFCFTTKRKVWEEIGPFDETYISYGEETNFWFSAIKQTDENGIILQNRGVIADNAYIFHERGTSFSQLDNEKHMAFRKGGSERFHKLNPDFQSWRQGFNEKQAVHHLRNELPKNAFKKQYKGNIAWVVKSAESCGGMNFITDIVNQLIEDGYNAKVCIIPQSPETDPSELKVTGNLRTTPVFFKDLADFTATFTKRVFNKGKVFAAVPEITPAVWNLEQIYPGIEAYNHVQSYDVELIRTVDPDKQKELKESLMKSYHKLPNIVSSNWIANTLRDRGCDVKGVILPGINPDLFHPRNRDLGDERFTIAVMVNDIYKFKGAQWAYEFIKALKPERNAAIRVLAIGPIALKGIRGITCLGNLPPAKMATLLGTEVDVLVDPSEIHSYGLPALEALYSGCQVLTRENKGIHEYKHLWNKKVTIEDNPQKAADKVLSLLNKSWERNLIKDAKTNRPINIREFINFVFPKKEKIKYNIDVVTPHLRKHGGPTTIISMAQQLRQLNHNVSISTIYTDWNPEVLSLANGLNVRTTWNSISDETKAVIINSDNPFAQKIMEKYPDKKYIMLKLSHNPRFQVTENENLNLPWDHIMTTTNWLRSTCINPLGGKWDHQSWDPDKVTVVGWYHYSHDLFSMPPTNRLYGCAAGGFRLGTLIHEHPLKGTHEALGVIDALKRKYEANFHAVGIGECQARLPQHMQYIKNANRAEMAHVFKQLDVWFGASHSEGLGRMALEAMSAGMAVVTTNTGAEFLKDGENCLLYEIGDPQAGADAIDKLVNDQELFTQIVVNGYTTAASAASPENFKQNLNTVLRKVLK